MARPAFDSEKARAAGLRSAEARRHKAQRSGPIDLPPFTDVASVQRALELFARAAAAGQLPGTQLGAGVRGCEVWLKAEAHRVDLERMKTLEARIAELEEELAAARRESWQESSR